MAESSWPSPSNGRVLDDFQFEKFGIGVGFHGGVLGDFTSPQLVYGDSSGRQIKYANDRYALVRGHIWSAGSSIITTAIAANTSGSTRVDLAVLRLSRTTWDVNFTVIAGTPGAGAPAPTFNTSSTGNFDLPLATITVANNASTITAGNVTYVAQHLAADGSGLRVPSLAVASYILQPVVGMEATLADGTRIVYNGSAWVAKWAWTSYSPTVWQNMSTTRTAVAGGNITINAAKYMQVGKLVHVLLDINISGATTNGVGVQLPVNAAYRYPAVGGGFIMNTSGAPGSQSGVASLGPGTPTDNVIFTTPQNVFINTVSGTNSFRAQLTYEAA